MQTLTDFFRQVYVPTRLKDRSKRTRNEYQTTVNLVVEILENPSIPMLGMYRNQFIDELRKRGVAEATIAKHIRNLNAIFRQFPGKQQIHWGGNPIPEKDPRIVSDAEFQALYRAFGNEKHLPKYLPERLRPHYFRTIMVFAATTALRKEAIFGVEFRDVHWQEQYLVVRREIDKRKKRRYKPLTPQLLAMLDTLRVYADKTGRIFPWNHGGKSWYATWRTAQETAETTLGLHDLKRYSGELALRAGASVLELQQHMDHANIATTTRHYVRPQTTELVGRLKVPIPEIPPDPLAENEERMEKAGQWIDEQRLFRLLAAGIDLNRLADAIRRTGDFRTEFDDRDVWETSTGTSLRIFSGEGEAGYA